MSQPRNYADTGAQEGGGGGIVYLRQPKDGDAFVASKQGHTPVTRNHIAGYFTNVRLQFDEGNPTAKEPIPPAWKLSVYFEAQDAELGTASEATGGIPVATFCLDIRQTNRYLLTKAIDALLACAKIDSNWDESIKIGVVEKEPYFKTTWVAGQKSARSLTWIDDGGGYQEIPKATPTGAWVGDRQVFNHTVPDNARLDLAKKVHAAMNRTKDPVPAIPHVSERGYKSMGVTAETVAAATAAANQKSTSPAPPAITTGAAPAALPPAPPSTTKSTALSPEAFEAAIIRSLANVTNILSINDIWMKTDGYRPTEWTEEEALQKFLSKAFDISGLCLRYNAAMGVIAEDLPPAEEGAAAAAMGADDLPF